MGASLNVFVEWFSRVLKNKRLINQAFLLALSGGAGGNRTTIRKILLKHHTKTQKRLVNESLGFYGLTIKT